MHNWSYDRHRLAMGIALLFPFLLLSISVESANGQLVIYPAQGQPPEQQQKDEFECHQWAVQQTGYDPTQAQPPAQQKTTRQGGALRGAAGGALVGAGIGAITGDVGKGAAIGAGAGAVAGGVKQRHQNVQSEAANQQATASQQAQLDGYNKARSACLEGRGYTVK